jgi:hypothetical protein
MSRERMRVNAPVIKVGYHERMSLGGGTPWDYRTAMR